MQHGTLARFERGTLLAFGFCFLVFFTALTLMGFLAAGFLALAFGLAALVAGFGRGALVTFSAALLLSLVSFVKWKLTLFAGIFPIAAGASWVAGLAVEKDYLYAQFNQWTAVTHDLSNPSFSPSIGPYIAMAAGVLYLGCYFLSRADVLEWPKD